jgi:hypothetical protein
MECAHPHFVDVGDAEGADSLLHFSRCLVRECQREYAIGLRACILENVGNPVDNGAGFAAAGPAKIRSGPLMVCTAFCCMSLSPSSKFIA